MTIQNWQRYPQYVMLYIKNRIERKMVKLGRNDLCPCGSGKKYKHCCMNNVSTQHAEMFNELAQIIAMNPSLTLDELNAVAAHKMNERNNQPHEDFCGLSPTQMTNWLYAPLNELAWVSINTPGDVSSSPVMRYLTLILDEAMLNGGSFKATSKGNLPIKLVKQASALLSEFAVSKFSTPFSIHDYTGANEDKFNALHYTRILAEISGIIYRRNGQYHVKKTAQKQYQHHGIHIFFQPMLEAATRQYNWGYLDSWEHDIDLRTFWLFMLWRLQSHSNLDRLYEEVATAFPDLLLQFPQQDYLSPIRLLGILIESRFIERFLQFWGFVTVDPKRFFTEEDVPRKAEIQPLLRQTFQFNIEKQ